MRAVTHHLTAIFVTLGLVVTTAYARPASTQANLLRRIGEVKRRLDRYAVKPTVNGRVKGAKVGLGSSVGFHYGYECRVTNTESTLFEGTVGDIPQRAIGCAAALPGTRSTSAASAAGRVGRPRIKLRLDLADRRLRSPSARTAMV